MVNRRRMQLPPLGRVAKSIARIRIEIDPENCGPTSAAAGNSRIPRNFFSALNEFFLEVW
jgi:hypothetical protein